MFPIKAGNTVSVTSMFATSTSPVLVTMNFLTTSPGTPSGVSQAMQPWIDGVTKRLAVDQEIDVLERKLLGAIGGTQTSGSG